MTKGLALTLKAAGVLVIAWGMLLGLTLDTTIEGIGSALVFAFYGVLVIRADHRAVWIGWGVTILMAVATILEGFGPVLALVWCGFLVLSSLLLDVRDSLRSKDSDRDSTALPAK